MDKNKILLNLIRENPFLYDVNHKEYENMDKRKYTWIQIASSLNANADQCKRRWKALKASYRRCQRTSNQKWKYYSLMSFLDNVQVVRPEILSNENVEIVLLSPSENSPYEVMDAENNFPPFGTSSESTTQSQEDYDDDQSLNEFVQLTTSCVPKPAPTTIPKKNNQLDSTSSLFKCLAKKVREANLPQDSINKIEAKVSAIVFQEILNHHRKRDTSS